MKEIKKELLSDDKLNDVNGGVLDEYAMSTLDNLIKNMKGMEGYHAADLIRKIEQMPPTFFSMEIGDATMEEVSDYVYKNWDRF